MAGLDDPYIGREFGHYKLAEHVGSGKIGRVYRAERMISPTATDSLACKVIVTSKLKDGWQRELEKLVSLRSVPNVVQYHSHGTDFDSELKPIVWVLCEYVPGSNLLEYLELIGASLDMAFIMNIAETILNVLHACQATHMPHGDLHEGNILVSEPDTRLAGAPRRIFVSDFGYGGSHNEVIPKEDLRQLFAIVSRMLHRLDPAALNAKDRLLYKKIKAFLKEFVESEATQGEHVQNAKKLLGKMHHVAEEAEKESAAASRGVAFRDPGDYLHAEALGNSVDEWKSLFVPEFLAARDLLSRNITVLTGARGCGKTMAFRRLTAFMDAVVGEPSGVQGADDFVGFYLNCRDLVEAFPWLPGRLTRGMQEQIIHYFHLAWLTEILKTLAIRSVKSAGAGEWLDGFLSGLFGARYKPLPEGADVLSHARSFVEAGKEDCRMRELGSLSGLQSWPLARPDFLDVLQVLLSAHVAWIADRPIYLWLDDYTTPILTREVQQVINPIIYKRRSMLIFKISTEASTSFVRTGSRGRVYELHHDFELIDLATESLHQSAKSREEFLDKVFRPRIDRHPRMQGKELDLKKVLGKTELSNNKLAFIIRGAARSQGRREILYHGVGAFAGMWSSDVRTMIQMFVDMIREADSQIAQGNFRISTKTQNRVYKTAGGEFLVFAEAARNPNKLKRGPTSTKPGEPFGMHMRDIVEAFARVSRHEMTDRPLVSNQGRRNPKQAFRLEVIDKFDLDEAAADFCEGLVRYHLFLQDWRGKSVRGMITPRLYLNRVLIPYCNLTFSSHDNIHMTNDEFGRLLKEPKTFFDYWRRKRGGDGPGLLE